MNLLAVGISHHTAPVEVREKMWLSGEEMRRALGLLKDRFFLECTLVSTCNRTELYGLATSGAPVDATALAQFLIDFKKASGWVHPDHFRTLAAGHAVHHLFKVASGSDSLVIGDIQILGQVKDAFQLSREQQVLGPVMTRLMEAALHAGKRVRSETSISEGAISVSYAAVELASKIFADLSRKSALLIGAGETGELTMKHLLGKGIEHVRIVNRTREKAEALVAALGGTVVDYASLMDVLPAVDIVIASVAAPAYVITPADIQRVMRQRSHNPLILIDIGVPRNVDPASRKIDNVFLYDIDALNSMVDSNLDRRKTELPKVDAILREEVTAFFRWYDALQVGPTIQGLRDSFEAVRQQEVEKNIHRFRTEDRDLLELVTRRIVNKLLHQPMTALKEGAEGGNGEAETIRRIQMVRELFGIGKTERESDESE